MSNERFPIRIGRRSALLLRLLFGVRPDNAYVDLDTGPDGRLDAHFGRFGLTVPVANLASWRVEGPWRWVTAIGVRTSIRHRDVTFGGTNRGGVRIDFKAPVRFLFYDTPALYVTVDDLEGLAAALAAHGLPGEDARSRKLP
jgi:hypothetical protein